VWIARVERDLYKKNFSVFNKALLYCTRDHKIGRTDRKDKVQ